MPPFCPSRKSKIRPVRGSPSRCCGHKREDPNARLKSRRIQTLTKTHCLFGDGSQEVTVATDQTVTTTVSSETTVSNDENQATWPR